MVSIKFAALAFAALSALSGANAMPRVDAGVHRALRKQATVNLIVTMKDTTEAALESIKEADFDSRGARISALKKSLEEHAEETQASLTAILGQEADGAFTKTKRFWISNQVYIENASVDLLTKLISEPSIYEIREEQVLKLPELIVEDGQVTANATTEAIGLLANEWGVTKIAAPSVWDLGFRGEGIVVSSVDSGVRYTHTALSANFRSSYGWYDPEAERATPYDNNGHGTHTMGTIAGAGGIGVAPGAQWIACKGCRTDDCFESDLLSCAQFITCPTDTSGNNADCSKAPHLVSNSWGGGQGDTFYNAAVNAWQAAGIIPIFSIGNAGPACTTANSPADVANVIAVGSTTSADRLSSFSSKGPTIAGLVKPDISAPGSSVRSAWNTGNSAYNTISGTSMACPHVSGTVALLLQKNPDLTYSQIKTAVFNNADTSTLGASGYTCGRTADSARPNNQYGYGRLNALKAVNSV